MNPYKGLKRLGAGSSRDVYLQDKKTVLKVSGRKGDRLMRGLAQNRTEYETFLYATAEHGVTHLCPVIDITPTDEVVTMARAIPLHRFTKTATPKQQQHCRKFKKRLRMMECILLNAKSPMDIVKSQDDLIMEYGRKEYKSLINSKLFGDVSTLVFNYGLLVGDLVCKKAWGYYKGKFVLVDYGLTKATWNELYAMHEYQIV